MSDFKLFAGFDPGECTTGVAKYASMDVDNPLRMYDAFADNDKLLYLARTGYFDDCERIGIETMWSTYTATGHHHMRTVMFTGRLVEALLATGRSMDTIISVRSDDIKSYHCPTVPSKDRNDSAVRNSICIRFAEPCTPKQPMGPLKGLTHHAWRGFAAAMTVAAGVRSRLAGKYLLTFDYDWRTEENEELDKKIAKNRPKY